MKSPDLSPALAALGLMMRTRTDAMSLPEDLLHLAESAGLGDAVADQALKMLLQAAAAGNRGAVAGRVWPSDEEVLAAMAVRDGIRAAVAGEAAEDPAPARMQTIIVNGEAIDVPRRDGDTLWGVAKRAVFQAGYGDIYARPWEIKDALGSLIGDWPDPDRIRHISLPAGTAS